jgi:hypothetical protein
MRQNAGFLRSAPGGLAMAVRDEVQQPAERETTRRAQPWRDMLAQAPGLLLVGGVLMYGFLSICYDRFYGFLGVDPSDVGLSYTGTLARSSGFVVVYLTLAYIVSGIVRQDLVEIRRSTRGRPTRTSLVLAFAIGGLLVLVGVIWPPVAAGLSAEDVRAGKPVGPVLYPGPLPPLPVLAIHADPATVEPTGRPGDAPAAERLRGRKLLYLGQSGGTVVLYDAATQRAVYVPSSSVILHVANCDAKPPPDPSCQQVVRHGDPLG